MPMRRCLYEKNMSQIYEQRVAMEPDREDIDGSPILKNVIYAINNLKK